MKSLKEFIVGLEVLKLYRKYMKIVYSFQDPVERKELRTLYVNDFKLIRTRELDSRGLAELAYMVRTLEGNIQRTQEHLK